MNSRLQKMLEYMNGANLDSVLITDSRNLLYFTGFSGGEGYAVVTEDKNILATDFRYIEQAKAQCTDFEVVDIYEFELSDFAQSLENTGFENLSISLNDYLNYKKHFKNTMPVSNAFLDIRAQKDTDEIEKIRHAEHIGDLAFVHILEYLKPGVTERDIALEIDYFMRQNGATATSFDTIVAFGKHSSMPHAEPDNRKLNNNEFVLMDFGCVYDGYCSDMTRTVCLGKATDEMKAVYKTVLNAQQSCLEMLSEGVNACDVHNNAKAIIDSSYLNCFGHSLGHGVGLQIHERPNLSPKNNMPLKLGNVVTVEPGIYIPDFCGVRIEDLVLVTSDGIENFTFSDKKLLEL